LSDDERAQIVDDVAVMREKNDHINALVKGTAEPVANTTEAGAAQEEAAVETVAEDAVAEDATLEEAPVELAPAA